MRQCSTSHRQSDIKCDLGNTRSSKTRIQATPAPTLYQNVYGDDLHPAARCALDSTPIGNNGHRTNNVYTGAS
eukprot:6886877-Pyramimonas_sp.AAC.1